MEKHLKRVDFSEIISQAETHTSKTVYSNYAQFAFINNELFIDFYFIEPAKPTVSETAAATLVTRITVPANMAKGIATGLANAIATHEDVTKTKLPIQRGKNQNDKIVIWED